MNKFLYSFPLIILLFFGCKNEVDDNENDSNSKIIYNNGTYCAEVTLYNPNNGIEHTYSLNIEVYNNELTRILWNNIGWIDDSHFNTPSLSKDGTCSFYSDKGFRYRIKIIGPECNKTDIIPEQNIEIKNTYSLINCAESEGFTEQEIQKCEQRFGIQRESEINEEYCDLFRRYVDNMRILNKMSEEIENGKIENELRLGHEGDIHFQQVIAKRGDIYYLLDVQGNNEVFPGLIDFNPYSQEWQIVTVKNSFNTIPNAYYMKVLNEDKEIEKLEEESKQNLVKRTADEINSEN